MSFDLPKTELSPDPRIGACVYLLHGLLQRLEQQQPGLIDSMKQGALYDCAAIDPESSESATHGYHSWADTLRRSLIEVGPPRDACAVTANRRERHDENT
jgi:hypothetical protein